MHRIILVIVALPVLAGLAQAECGWLLMYPPSRSSTSDTESNFDRVVRATQKPIREWIQDSAYDSAAKCEAARDAYMMGVGRAMWTSFARCLPASQVPMR